MPLTPHCLSSLYGRTKWIRITLFTVVLNYYPISVVGWDHSVCTFIISISGPVRSNEFISCFPLLAGLHSFHSMYFTVINTTNTRPERGISSSKAARSVNLRWKNPILYDINVGAETQPWKLTIMIRKVSEKSTVSNFMFCWPCISIYACNETNLMHYLPSVYSVITPLPVSGLLVAHHQEVTMYICDNWYVLYVLVDCRPTCRSTVI
jgi:hypothetical protein